MTAHLDKINLTNQKIKKTVSNWMPFKRILALLLLLCVQTVFSQASGISLFWNTEVGCRVFSNGENDPRDPLKDHIPIEDIQDGNCIRFCENRHVTYTLFGDLGANPATVWTATGGTITMHSNTSCLVSWGAAGVGSISFSYTTPTGVITKTLCIEKIPNPTADFNIILANNLLEEPGDETDPSPRPVIYFCKNQTIYFHNMSSANNGTGLVSWLWDFGDGTTSSASDPSHIYTENGEYYVTLTVTNACGCTSNKKVHVIVKSDGFDILCPGVVCENQTVTYSLPFEGKQICRRNYNWGVNGGHIDAIDETNGDVTVTWTDVDSSGFGYVTFYPDKCRLDCLLPSTIKIPVIKQKGTIVGSATLCQGQQSIYKLPQWPTTDFEWEIEGDPLHLTALIVYTDQRNEIVVTALRSGTIVLRAAYQNTLLHCGGMAEFTITISKTNTIVGNNTVCQGSTETYSNDNGDTLQWSVIRNGVTVASATGSAITYTFLTTGNYIITATGTGICSNTSMGVAVVGTPPMPAIAPESGVLNSRTICPNAPYSYSIDNPITNIRYRWEVLPPGSGNILGSNIGTQMNIQFDGSATHQIRVYAESLTPIVCPSQPRIETITTQQINAEIVAYNGTVNPICHNSVGQYQVVIPGSSTLYTEGETYVWSITDSSGVPFPSLGSITQGQGTQQISILWNNVTSLTNAFVHLNIKKCTLDIKHIDFPVTIISIPTITINCTTSICSGAPNDFSISPALPLGTVVTWNFNGASVVSGAATVNHPFYSSSSTTNIIRTVTASIVGCGGAIATTLPVSITVFPAPSATNSITGGGNVFCDENLINTVLTAASSGNTIQWYNSNGPIAGATTGTYAPTTWGGYYFRTYGNNNCYTDSNSVFIVQFCPSTGTCVPSPMPQVTNNSSYLCTSSGITNSNAILLNGGASGSPTSLNWSVVGPVSVSSFTGSVLENVPAGEYNVFYNAGYPCASELFIKSAYKKIIVPYVPKFNCTKTCNGNTTFTIGVVDNTNFFDPVINRTFQYSYSTDGGSTWTTSITTPDGTIGNSMQPGNYLIKLVVQGQLPDATTVEPACEYVISFNLATLPAMSITVVTNPIKCHNTPVLFNVTNPSPGNSYMWTFDAGAQNTLQQPSRVFNTSGAQPVNVRVTNKYGCWQDLNIVNVNIPPKCFAGTVTPLHPPAVCAGTAVVLTYTPSIQLCDPQYVWMNGTQAVSPAVNAPTLSVTSNGFYWLKLISPDNCKFETTDRITPIFKTAPNVQLQTEGTICEDTNIIAKAITDATELSWSIDGTIIGYMANQTTATFNLLPAGTYIVSVTVTQGDCSTTASQEVIVTPAPDPPVISAPERISCNPYLIHLAATGATGNYTWSNGQQGDAINVTNGGAYQVRLTVGGCSSTAQVTVPKNPDNYSWIFPTGCVTSCDKEAEGTLIGPSLPLPYWAWLFNGDTLYSGNDSFPTHFPIIQTGTYNFVSNTGLCENTSPPFNYTRQRCERCLLEDIVVKEMQKNDTKYCSFSVILTIISNYTDSVTAVLTSYGDEAIISPSTITLTPGANNYHFTFVPINGFTGGNINLLLTIKDRDKTCQTPFGITLPNCGEASNEEGSKTALSEGAGDIILYPNPAKNEVHIAFTAAGNDSVLEIYDLTGRLIDSHASKEPKGDWTLSLNNFAAGVYVVVLYEHGQVVLQKKLIKE